MRKKLKWTMLLTGIVVLVLAGNASALTPVDYEWDYGGSPDRHWDVAANWNPDGVPDKENFDDALINIADANVLIDSGVAAEGYVVTVADNNGPCYLNVTGGSLTTVGAMYVGDDINGIGYLYISDGNVVVGGSELFIADGSNTASENPTYGTLVMSGGLLDCSGKIKIGKNKRGFGKVEMSAGQILVGDDVEMGNYGDANLTMTAGDINIVDRLKLAIGGGAAEVGVAVINMKGGNIWTNYLEMGDSAGTYNGSATIYLDGGTITTSTIDMYSDNALLDITEGTLIVETDDELEKVLEWRADGRIRAYGGVGIVDIIPPGDEIIVTGRMPDPNLAQFPNPINGAVVDWTSSGPTMSWTAGTQGNSHDVYFGDDESDVNDANNTPGEWEEFMGNQDPCTFDFNTPPPVLGQTYYWRIDEVNEANVVWKGDVWQYRIRSYIGVEDYESYDTEAALEAVWDLSGSDVNIENEIVNSGDVSMQYDYANVASTTKVVADVTGPNSLGVITQDWTSAQVKALVLYFYGTGTNAVEPMRVSLTDTSGTSDTVFYGDNGEDPNDIKVQEWTEWNIELSDFAIDLNNVNQVTIGFGNESSPSTGSGTVYFDDIRLYPTRCVAMYAPDGDVDGDCDVDFIDVNVVAGEWLRTDYNGPGFDAEVNDTGMWYNDTTGVGPRGRTVQFNGTDDWVDLNDWDFSNFHDKTISLWVKLRDYPSTYRYIFYFTDGVDVTPYRIEFRTYTEGYVRGRFLDDYTDTYLAGLAWTHLCVVLDDTPDGRCTATFYGDGSQMGTPLTGRPRHSGEATSVSIGCSGDGASGFIDAVVDDFRVYDRPLTSGEVALLAAGTEPTADKLLKYDFQETGGLLAYNTSTFEFVHPLHSDAELYEGEAEGSRSVNLMDYAIVAGTWLEEKQWP